jgi:hypothetical protein
VSALGAFGTAPTFFIPTNPAVMSAVTLSALGAFGTALTFFVPTYPAVMSPLL